MNRQINNNNNPHLQSSPTAATLHHYKSTNSFHNVPPLVSIH
jgi:hypothetical protein